MAFARFREKVPKEPPESGKSVLFNHEITDNEQLRRRFSSVRAQFTENIVAQLQAWFPDKDSEVVKNLQILDPQILPETMPSDYGMAKITALADHFDGNGLVSEDSEVWAGMMAWKGQSLMGGQWSARTCSSLCGRWFWML